VRHREAGSPEERTAEVRSSSAVVDGADLLGDGRGEPLVEGNAVVLGAVSFKEIGN